MFPFDAIARGLVVILKTVAGSCRRAMRGRILAALLAALFLSSTGHAQDVQERPDWEKCFRAFNAMGTIVVADERAGKRMIWVYDDARAQRRYHPASTFKVPHALFALDAGAARDEFQIFRWDGVKRSFEAWNRDQDLRSSMRGSVLWVYQGFAKVIGDKRAGQYLQSLAYGNADPSGGIDGYWLDGNLAISAHEQIAFLRRLYRNDLPFQREHQRLVKDIIVNKAGKDWILRAKTGWDGQTAWWTGWIEWPGGPVFFALNIDTPRKLADTPKREAVVQAVLLTIGAWPSE
jgi:beta-lactamase class D